ncbi:hypothetical protein EMIT0373P_10104 [Pseudomonas chlororaphis]
MAVNSSRPPREGVAKRLNIAAESEQSKEQVWTSSETMKATVTTAGSTETCCRLSKSSSS